MKKNLESALEVVRVLNEIYASEIGTEGSVDGFSYSSNGTDEIIEFRGAILWKSLEEERDFDEEQNDYEPLLPFILKKYKKFREELPELSFK